MTITPRLDAGVEDWNSELALDIFDTNCLDVFRIGIGNLLQCQAAFDQLPHTIPQFRAPCPSVFTGIHPLRSSHLPRLSHSLSLRRPGPTIDSATTRTLTRPPLPEQRCWPPPPRDPLRPSSRRGLLLSSPTFSFSWVAASAPPRPARPPHPRGSWPPGRCLSSFSPSSSSTWPAPSLFPLVRWHPLFFLSSGDTRERVFYIQTCIVLNRTAP